jgi:hypothetical protein
MKTASQLSKPEKYFKAYQKGKFDKENGSPHNNPYYHGAGCLEEFEGYTDGYNENKITSLRYFEGHKRGVEAKNQGVSYRNPFEPNVDHAYFGFKAGYNT